MNSKALPTFVNGTWGDEILNRMLTAFNLKEFEQLLFAWDDAPDIEEFGDVGKSELFKKFIEYCERHGMSQELVRRLSIVRRHIYWPEC